MWWVHSGLSGRADVHDEVRQRLRHQRWEDTLLETPPVTDGHTHRSCRCGRRFYCVVDVRFLLVTSHCKAHKISVQTRWGTTGKKYWKGFYSRLRVKHSNNASTSVLIMRCDLFDSLCWYLPISCWINVTNQRSSSIPICHQSWITLP